MPDFADTSKKFMTGITGIVSDSNVADTGHRSFDTNITELAHKNSITLHPNNQGAVGNWLMKKPEAEHVVSVYL